MPHAAKAESGASLTTLYVFGGPPDGQTPNGNLVEDAAGNFYGTTTLGGTYGDGAIFRMAPPATAGGAWTETVLYSFKHGADGGELFSGLVLGQDGALYGAASFGGTFSADCPSGCGTVFQLSPPTTAGGAWTLKVLYSFSGGDGKIPEGGLVFGQDGTLVGTTTSGGQPTGTCCGTVFQLTPLATAGSAWTYTLLYAFQGLADGLRPSSALVLGADGSLYGDTFYGGEASCGRMGCGTVFQLVPPATPGGVWTKTTLHVFSYAFALGPNGPLVFDSQGALYGTTFDIYGVGSAFQLAPPATSGGAWTFTTIHGYTTAEGNPSSGLILDRKGALYGTTFDGGVSNAGTVFRLNPPSVPGSLWTETVLYSFTGGGDGSGPEAALVFGADGGLYGVAATGGSGNGTVFERTL
jgi:uncharacterized repeat protein (TIGR03803 family)